MAENRAARYHSQGGNSRKAVDNAFGDAIAQIFRIRVAAGILKRQHSYGSEDVGGSPRSHRWLAQRCQFGSIHSTFKPAALGTQIRGRLIPSCPVLFERFANNDV